MAISRFLPLLGLLAAPALGQAVSVSPGPDSVSVTVYRDPRRDADEPFNLGWLNGYALITERRTVDIPAGEADIRFEAVAGGIVPQSAIVTGLPDGIVEKNRDARLLSPGSLLDASLGRRVHVRRTSLATGEVTETDAVVRSGVSGAVVLETRGGVEALRCTGVAETPIYSEVPAGLSAKPTLSVRTRATAARRSTLTLSYLTSGFDWQADYIAELSPDGKRMDLFAWLTLANGDETGFARADTQAVAGRLGREDDDRSEPEAPPVRLQCWPGGTTTSDLREYQPPPPAPPPDWELSVSGRRINYDSVVPITSIGGAELFMIAAQENLGDLKLYRIPEPVTVAPRSQKQVALLRRARIPVRRVYRWLVSVEAVHGLSPTLVTRNREEEGLGLPLPAGRVAFFEVDKGRRILVGQGKIDDVAVGELLELETGVSTDVVSTVVRERDGPDWDDYKVIVTNAKPFAVDAEIELYGVDVRFEIPGRSLEARDGKPLWRTRVPANGSAELRYRMRPEA